MIPSSFTYQKATTVEDAIKAFTGDTKILAGGHSLIPSLKLRLNQTGKLIDISSIAALKGITEASGTIVIGAATTHAEIASNKIVQSKFPMLAQAAKTIGDIQVRNKGTIGGSLAHADPAADWTAAVLAADSTVVVKGAKGERKIKATEFFKGMFTTALQQGEIITSIHFPIPTGKSVYLKFSQPASRFAIVGCAVVRNGDKTNIAFTGVSATAFRDTTAEKAAGKLDTASIEAASQAAAEGVSILSDNFASEKYRKHLAKVFLKRALTAVV
jgi:aerobic carbon-monoxide dehydrogenase medium subunit